MSDKVYFNSGIIERIGVNVNVSGQEVMLDLKDHAKGVVGAIFVFDTEENAQAYDVKKPVYGLTVIEHNGEKAAMQ